MTTLLALVAMLLQFAPPAGLIRSVTSEKISSRIAVLAHDSLEGRGLGTRGDRKAADYIASQFRAIGLAPAGDSGAYIQHVPLVGIRLTQTGVLEVSNGSRKCFLAFPDEYTGITGTHDTAVVFKDAGMVFVGYGIVAPEQQWDDFKDVDVRGKILLMMNNDPSACGPECFGGKRRTRYGRWTYKHEIAAAKGALGAIIIHTTPTAGYPYSVVRNGSDESFYLDDSSASDGLAFKAWTSEEATRAYLALAGWSMDSLFALAESRTFRPIDLGLTLSGTLRSSLRQVVTSNVIGRLEGSDPAFKDQYLVFTAHYDHLGIQYPINGDSIYNGALDDASGTALVIALAEAFAHSPVKPKRSLLFVASGAEEQQLLGSKYFAVHPPVPISHIAADLNFDDANFIGPTSDIFCRGSEYSSLGDDLAAVASELGMTVQSDPHPEQGRFYRSDHFSYAKAGVPAISIAFGTTVVGVDTAEVRRKRDREDSIYHQPSDEIYEDWNYDDILQQAVIAIRVAWRVANAPAMPTWNAGSEFDLARKRTLQ